MPRREYIGRSTIYPAPGVGESGAVNVYACGADPNGVITWAEVGDRAYSVGSTDRWVCSSSGPPAVWIADTGGASSRTQFTWSPGSTTDADNGFYGTWDEAYDAAAPVALWADVSIVVDFGLGGAVPAVIPAGEYDMYRIALVGATEFTEINFITHPNGLPVTTSEGTTFVNFTQGTRGIAFTHDSTTPLVTLTAADTVYNVFMGDRAAWATADTGAIFALSGGAYLNLNAGERSRLGAADGGNACISVGSTSGLSYYGDIRSIVSTEALSGAVDAAFVSLYLDTTTVWFAQANVLGTLDTFTNNNGSYFAANLVDWSNIDPVSVANALDRLASASGPIA